MVSKAELANYPKNMKKFQNKNFIEKNVL